MSIEKYKNKLILIELVTDSYKNDKYKDIKKIYLENIYKFHKLNSKIITKLDKEKKIEINVYNFNSKLIKKYKNFNLEKILKFIEKIPKDNLKIKQNLSLYDDYNPKTTITGLGYKDKEKALYTINKIKDMDKKYQFNVINTMINRAKYHKNQNDNMKEAIKIFEKWLKKNNYK